MDSETTAAAAANNAVSVSPSQENGGGLMNHSEPSPSEHYETAAALEKKAPVAASEKGEDPDGVFAGKPNLDDEGIEVGGIPAAEVENGVPNGRDEKLAEVEVPDSGDHGEKGEILGDGMSLAADSAAEGEEEEVKDQGLVAGTEENGVSSAKDEVKDENSNPVGVEENGKPSTQEEEKDEGLGEEDPKAVSSIEEEVEAESKTQTEKNTIQEPEVSAVEADTDVASVQIVGSDQNLEKAAVENMKPVSVELTAAADAERVDGVVEDTNVEESAVPVANEKETVVVDGLVESKPVEEDGDVGAAKENGVSDNLDAEQEPKESPEPVPATASAPETNGATDNLGDDHGLVEATEQGGATDSVDADLGDDKTTEEPVALKAPEEDISGTETDKNEITDAASLPKINNQETNEEAVSNPDQSLADLEAKPTDDGENLTTHPDLEPPTALEEISKSEETETKSSEDSGAMESGTGHEASVERALPVSVPAEMVVPEADGSHVADDDDDENPTQDVADEEEDGNVFNQPRVAILDSSETAKQIIKEMEEGSSATSFESSRSYQHQMDGQIVTDSDEEVDTDEEGDGKELFDSAALAALLKAATGGGSSDGNITITSQDGTRVFSMDRPAGLGSSAPALRPTPGRSSRPTPFSSSELAVTAEPENEMDEEEKKLHEKVEDIRVKFLRLVMRLGHNPEDTVAAQVLYRLSLAEGIRRGRQMSRAFSIETAKKKAMQLEADGEEDLNFSCNILVLGKTGVGKSATINSIFGEEKSHTNAFQVATTSVREISGVVDGVKIRVIDTPGLRSSVMDQAINRRILSSIKKYTKKCPPDIVLYVDRLDTQTRDFNDLPLLRSITSALGSSIWFNATVALTHAASAPPEGPNGSPLSYEVFIAQRSHVVQHSIRQAAGDMRLMNPVALVENHPSCRRNREGQRVLPNGLSWRPQMLLLCYSSKILSEANTLLKLQDSSPGKLFGFRLRSPPLPYLLSTLLQSRPHPKLPNDQGGDNGDSDIDLDDFSDGEDEEEDEYDQLPPFKPLKKSQLAKLTKEQRRAYFDEYDYRVKLLQKKQFKEEIRRLKEMKKRGKSNKEEPSPYVDMGDDYDQDGAPAAVPVPLPDMVLPPSFDCDIPTYRYRFLEPTSQLLTRPVLDTHGWDHDCGYDGVSIEESLALANRFPAAVAVQITKDKKDFNIHLDSSIAAKHGENGSTLAGFDIQSVGKQLAYILRGDTKFKTFKKNKTTAGVSVTFLGETVATGLKVEDQLMIGKRLGLVASTGAVRAQGDVAYGANLEVRLREKDYPIGQALSTLGFSLMKWRTELALGANLQSQVNVGRNSKVAVRVGLNNKLSGQVTVRTSTSEQLQLALVGIIPVALSIYRSIWADESDMAH